MLQQNTHLWKMEEWDGLLLSVRSISSSIQRPLSNALAGQLPGTNVHLYLFNILVLLANYKRMQMHYNDIHIVNNRIVIYIIFIPTRTKKRGRFSTANVLILVFGNVCWIRFNDTCGSSLRIWLVERDYNYYILGRISFACFYIKMSVESIDIQKTVQ